MDTYPEYVPYTSNKLKALGLYNFVRRFRGAYKRGRLYSGGLITRLKKCFKTSCIAVLIKILFEFDRFFELQNVVKSRIHFNTG